MTNHFIITFALIISQCGILSACAQKTWPVQTYTTECPARIMPDKPACVNGRWYKSSSQEEACYKSMNNYAASLDNWAYCLSKETSESYRIYLTKANGALSCFDKALKGELVDGAPPTCQRVKINIDQNGFVATYATPLNPIPFCISDRRFFPKDNTELLDCGEDILEHATDNQLKFDRAKQGIIRIVKKEYNNAGKTHLCMMVGEDICY